MLRFYILIQSVQSLASLSGDDLILSRSLNIYTHGILTKLFKNNLPVGSLEKLDTPEVNRTLIIQRSRKILARRMANT